MSRYLVTGAWGWQYNPAEKEARAYGKALEAAVEAKYGEISHQHRELIAMAVRCEHAARVVQVDVRRSRTKKDDEIPQKQRLDALKQHIYFNRERLLAVKQLGILDAEVRPASGRGDVEEDPFDFLRASEQNG